MAAVITRCHWHWMMLMCNNYHTNAPLSLWTGAFLIPCFISMFLCGIPMLALESAIGQFCSQGPIHVWRATPIMQGRLERKRLILHFYHVFKSLPCRFKSVVFSQVLAGQWLQQTYLWQFTTASSLPMACTTCLPPCSLLCRGPAASAGLTVTAATHL